MPLFKTIHYSTTTTILVWHITETFLELSQQVLLNPASQDRLNTMKSQLHQRAFLSVRKLLATAGYTDFDLYYDTSGKPHLKDGKYVSITHSHEFAAIIISHKPVGIDIELQREKILKIADKFVTNTELEEIQTCSSNDYTRQLTVKWGAKEAIFKIRNQKGISFKNHIQVSSFKLNDKQTTALLNFDNTLQKFKICFEEINNYILVYAFEQI